MKFTCAFKPRCRRAGVWAVQNHGVGGALVCEAHKDEAITFYSRPGKDASVWRDGYFEVEPEQQALDLRFGDIDGN